MQVSLIASAAPANMSMSKAAPARPTEAPVTSPWAWIREGLTLAEKRQCHHMLANAILSGESEQVWKDALHEFKQTRRDLQASGLWEQVCAFYRERRSRETEQAKRGRDEVGSPRMTSESFMDEDFLLLMTEEIGYQPDANDEPWPTMLNDGRRFSSTGMFSTNQVAPWTTTMPSSYSSGSAQTPFRSAPLVSPSRRSEMRVPTETMPRIVQEFDIEEFEFPEDISSWEQWGRTIIAFGKYNGRKISYNNLAESTDPAFRDYRQWVLSRVNTSSGQCQDLGRFLRVYDLKNGVPKTIPGTNMIRTYAS